MRLAALVLLAAGLGAACSSNSEPHGSPVLLSAFWLSAGAKTQIWTVSDPSLPPVAVTAAGQEVDFVFDRLLDGNRIEDTVDRQRDADDRPQGDAAHHRHLARRRDGHEHAAVRRPGALQQRAVLRRLHQLRPPESRWRSGSPRRTRSPSRSTRRASPAPTATRWSAPVEISVATAAFSASFRLPQGANGADGGANAVPSSYMLPVVFSNRVAGPVGRSSRSSRRARTASRCPSR